MNKSPISLLQERALASGFALPNYSIVQEGARFKCVIRVKGLVLTALGDNKKKAKHNAAELAVNLLDNNKYESDVSPITNCKVDSDNSHRSNAVGKLNELCSKNCNIYPTYESYSTSQMDFVFKCKLFHYETEGTGRTKKDAKQEAAEKMLDKVQINDFSTYVTRIAKQQITANQDQTAIDLFKELSLTKRLKIEDSSKVAEDKLTQKTNFIFKENLSNARALKNELNNLNITFKIFELQQTPLILCLKTDSSKTMESQTFLQCGTNHDETELTLLQKAFHSICIMLSI